MYHLVVAGICTSTATSAGSKLLNETAKVILKYMMHLSNC